MAGLMLANGKAYDPIDCLPVRQGQRGQPRDGVAHLPYLDVRRVRTRGDRLGHAFPEALTDQTDRHHLQGADGRGDLREHVHTTGVLVHHPVNAAPTVDVPGIISYRGSYYL